MSFLICSCLLFSWIDAKYLLDYLIFGFIIFSSKIVEVLHFFTPHYFLFLHSYLSSFVLTRTSSLFSQELWDLLFFIYLRYASPETMFCTLIPGPVIAHCTVFKIFFPSLINFLSIVICQHLSLTANIFRFSSHLFYLTTQGPRHTSTPIFFCYFD